MDVQQWLAQAPYTQARKTELLNKHQAIRNKYDPRLFTANCFVKAESYNKYKYPRIIFSRSDEFKTLVGPTFSLIDDAIFALRWFIKKTPNAERPKKIIEQLYRSGATYSSTDYISYESSFRRLMFETVELPIYDFLTQLLPNHDEFMWYVDNVMCSWNLCQFKDFNMAVYCTRCSGDQNTSCGNGIYNLAATLFLYYEKIGIEALDLAIYVEGDDGLQREIKNGLNAKDYASVGLAVDITKSDKLTALSFCGIVMDDRDMINVTDPICYISDFFWLNRQYFAARQTKLEELLKCKALSALYQYPGCPIIYPLAKTMIRLLSDVILDEERLKVLMRDNYKYEEFMTNHHHYLKNPQMYDIPIPTRTRQLVEDLFRIPINAQITIEREIENHQSLPIAFSNYIYQFVPKMFLDFYDNYTADATINIGCSTYPYTNFDRDELNSMIWLDGYINNVVDPTAVYNAFKKQLHVSILSKIK